MTSRRRIIGGTVAAAALLPFWPARAQGAPLSVIAFQGASNWPMWVGLERGHFRDEGLNVTLAITPNSVELARGLYDGRHQIALTAVDNVVAYAEGQGEAQLPGPSDFFAFMGIDDGVLTLMAEPGINSVADLRGRGPFAVDALTTGYAFALREMLRRAGVPDEEAPFQRVGGHALRLAALRERRTRATLLTTPLDLIAAADGFRPLARAAESLGAYAGVTGNARRAWAVENRDTLVRFIRAWRRSVDWIVAPENRAQAVALFRERLGGNLDPAIAEGSTAVLLDPRRGIRRDLSIDPAGFETVLRLRSEQAEPRRALRDPSRYIDLSYLEAAGRG
ncbi:ABC transporter substrate-binding protein [Roseomonas populi]|uniref:ABC transporter substrate-binding protein n=1 Tax=Roseomonas populi TaxID=3121582 RepID=A0ABT1X0I1_9PROT|nr:ABC transporter substrate-binding protein [Roseomonas pecuniae]MCR0981615.1 ABC transporter substrate-binding protein [Roseomonas pecuniae]